MGKKESEKNVGSHNRNEERACTEEEKSVYIIKRGERGGIWVYLRTINKEYIRLLKLSQTVSVFFVRNKDSKKWMV